MRKFNVTGQCMPNQDYMVDISNKISQIMVMVERGDYFTINRARQYGKTTTLWRLDDELVRQGYTVAHISFEGIGDTPFENEKKFCKSLLRQITGELKSRKIKGAAAWEKCSAKTFEELDVFLNVACKDKKIVLMIDETDKTSNNLVFLRFIGMLRNKYLLRKNGKVFTFQSVILCGVYDIKNLKVKLIKSGQYQLQDGEKRINSPWNIAADFEVDMSFSTTEIAGMLNEYEKDHKTGMDIETISEEIRVYTNGYPYLVSRLCKTIDEKLNKDWTLNGLQQAIKLILIEQSTLFDDLIKNIEADDELNSLLKENILNGERIPYNADNYAIRTGLIFGIFLHKGESAAIHNRIFEIRLYNYYISQKAAERREIPKGFASDVIENGKFNMPLAIKKFMAHYYELYNKSKANFLEGECRLLFLTYIRPLINGNGFYHIESETRDSRRMDVIIDFGSEQFIIELKIWKGEQKHEKAHEQLIEYLNSKNKSEGYLLTFDFRKKKAKKPSAKWVRKSKKKFLDCLCI
ncbi:MAG: AAA-like domain-containing protein [Fibromonadales bacterium]|nr:AAA-like domain-containing protein [Fibromonadales bacterium]